MPNPATRVATFYDREILKYPVGTDAVKSVVIDASEIDVDATNGRYVVPAGTVMVLADDNKRVKPAAASGESAGDVVGILAHTIEIYGPPADDGTTDEPAAVYFFNCIFNADQLTHYSGNSSAVQTALSTCIFA